MPRVAQAERWTVPLSGQDDTYYHWSNLIQEYWDKQIYPAPGLKNFATGKL